MVMSVYSSVRDSNVAVGEHGGASCPFGVRPRLRGGALRRPRKSDRKLFRASSTSEELFGALSRRGAPKTGATIMLADLDGRE